MPSLPLRPGFGPPLRLSGRGRVLLAAGLAAVVVVVIVSGDDREHVVVRAQPTFNVLYDDARLRAVEPGAGEALRLEGRRRGVRTAVVVRPVELEPYRGDVSSGLLPVLAERHLDDLRARFAGFQQLDEGRARVSDSAGYQVGFRADGDVAGRDVFVVDGPQARRAYLVSLLVRGDRRRAPKLVYQARRAFRSFAFGTDPA